MAPGRRCRGGHYPQALTAARKTAGGCPQANVEAASAQVDAELSWPTGALRATSLRGLVVHALSEEAKAFHVRLGLDESPLDPMTLMVTVADLHAALPR